MCQPAQQQVNYLVPSLVCAGPLPGQFRKTRMRFGKAGLDSLPPIAAKILIGRHIDVPPNIQRCQKSDQRRLRRAFVCFMSVSYTHLTLPTN